MLTSINWVLHLVLAMQVLILRLTLTSYTYVLHLRLELRPCHLRLSFMSYKCVLRLRLTLASASYVSQLCFVFASRTFVSRWRLTVTSCTCVFLLCPSPASPASYVCVSQRRLAPTFYSEVLHLRSSISSRCTRPCVSLLPLILTTHSQLRPTDASPHLQVAFC